jgi:hypothetical protein
MNFDSASILERDADVNVRGVTPQPPEVYLGIEKINMPRSVPGGGNEGRFLQGAMQRLIEYGGPLGDKLKAALRQLSDPGREQTQKQRLDKLVSVLAAQSLSQAEIDSLFPTFRVHVYHDTGERVRNASGVTVPVYRAQSSFGVYAYHEGPIVGWNTSIQGAERTADNMYRVAIPANGVAKIRVRIQGQSPGEEPIRQDPIVTGELPGGCLVAVWRAIKRLLGL